MHPVPPTITAPGPITVEQAGPSGTPASSVNLGTPTVSDACDPNPKVTNDEPTTFPPGQTTVTWTATDASGNKATATQIVTVKDTTPPTINEPGPITVQQTGP